MKSFSIKALALAFVVVTGSAQAGITEYVTAAKNHVSGALKAADVRLFGEWTRVKNEWPFDTTHKDVFTPGMPILSTHLHFKNGYARAGVIVAAGLTGAAIVTAAACKIYRHFRPAADATVEGENVDANQAESVQ